MDLHDKYRCTVEVDGWERGHDIVIGISTYNEEGFVIQALRCIKKVLPKLSDRKISIVNVDSNSSDDTKDSFLHFDIDVDQIYISTLESDNPYGKNLYNLLSEAYHFDENVKTVAFINNSQKFTFHSLYNIINTIQRNEKDLCRLSSKEFESLDYSLYSSIYEKLGLPSEGISSTFAFNLEKFSKEILSYKWKEFTWQGGVSSLFSIIAFLRNYEVYDYEAEFSEEHDDFVRANLYQTYDCIHEFDLLDQI